jgi:putative GTP pyrophosphokinase
VEKLPSKSQIDELGKRLGHTAFPAAEDLALLQAYRAAHAPALRNVVSGLRELGFEAVPRLKTPTTIIDKVVREKTRLSAMQDIAGARVVVGGTTDEQDTAVRSIHDRFGGRIVDRRQVPSYGYRAVHLVAIVEGFSVEIQVRTRLQNLWAQVMERTGDIVGRGVRYGDLPDDPARRNAVNALLEMADAIASHETHWRGWNCCSLRSRPWTRLKSVMSRSSTEWNARWSS